MSKFVDADRLNAAIVKHIKEVKDAGKRFTPNMGFFDAKLSGIYDVQAIIDSLRQEQPEVDLEKELDQWRHEHFAGERDGHYSGEYLERNSQLDLARHFFNLVPDARKEK